MTVPGPSYPGNPSLSPEVRQRVETTYRQSLELAARGNRQEASLGCDFVLQLDPDFAPAQELLDRLESGKPIAGAAPAAAASGPVAARKAEAEELFGGLDSGGSPELPGLFDLPELPDLPGFERPAAVAAAPAADAGDGLGDRLAALVAAGRHGEALELARAQPEQVAAEPRAAELAETAAARQEAAPYVERFLASAATARRQGDDEAARALLDKARALDPSHPGLAAALAAAPTAGGAPAPGNPPPLGAAPATPPVPVTAPASDAADADPFAALGGSDEQRRIDDLLAEGQAAFDRGDHQAAIDAWSRTFLIDIDNREAARRIEEARRLKAEQERRVEEVFHDAERALERGDREAARAGYEQVLAAQAGHLEARQRLDSLDAGGDDLAAAIGAAAAAAGMVGGAPAAPALEPAAHGQPLREEILVPPEPGAEAPAAASETAAGRRVAVAREGRAGRRFALIGTLVLLAVVAAGYLLWDNRARIFPNAEEAAAPVVEEDAIARATRLHRAGRTAIAINQLRRLPPSAPEYAEAQALISQWEAESAAPPSAAATEETAADPAAAERQALIDEARQAAGRDDYLMALSRLEQAATLAPLDGEAAALAAEIERDLAPVARLVELVRQGDHERALPDLWRRLEANPDDRVVRHLIVEAYYRMGARDLQRGDAAAAAAHLAEAAELAPDDPLLARHQRFAESYARRDKDLLYRIYVKYLPPR